ncbi:hypothetical protein BDW75DRAFT_79702 [Aspergillus navahoensis]
MSGRITFGHMSELHQELIELLLAIRQLPTSTEINSEAVHNAVDDQHTGISNVLLSRVRINAKPFCDLPNTLRTECAFCVNIGHLALCTAHVLGKLCDNRHGVGELGLAAAELAEYFADAHTLKTTAVCQ